MTEPGPLRDHAYERFTEQLLLQRFRPGQFVSQSELVAVTGLALGTIREIVPRLEADGLLRTIPRRGMQISPIDLPMIREAFQFRLIVEREAVALFAGSASNAVLADLRRSHEDVLVAVREGRSSTATAARAQRIDWAMHDAIVVAVGNTILTRAYMVNAVKIRLIHQERVRIVGRVETAMEEHLDILAALAARDPDRAVAAMTRHIDTTRRIALDL